MTTMTAHRVTAKIGTLVALVLCAMFAMVPVLWMFASSLKPNTEIFLYPPRWLSPNSSFSAYLDVFKDPTELDAFKDSYIVATSVTLLTIFVALMAGYAISRFDFPGKRPVMTLVIAVQSLPPISLIIPYLGLITAIGLFDTYEGLILTHMVLTFPYAIVMMTAYLDTLPKTLDEAARVDGAGSWRILWRVLFPLALPGLVSVGVYTFMLSWNEFLFALELTRVHVQTVPIRVAEFIGQNYTDWNQMFAMSILGCLPVLVLFLIFQRYFLGGLTAGSVKG
jgi:multiple sugar transport system permease protein